MSKPSSTPDCEVRWYHHVLASLIFYVLYWPRLAPRMLWQTLRLWWLTRKNRKLRREIADLNAAHEALLKARQQ